MDQIIREAVRIELHPNKHEQGGWPLSEPVMETPYTLSK
jgi:hypothetical protein